MLLWFNLFVAMFALARLFGRIGRSWGFFARTTWKQDLVAAVLTSYIVALLMMLWTSEYQTSL